MDGHQHIYFAGGGNMASAMIKGLETLASTPQIVVCDPNPAALERHAAKGRQTLPSLDEVSGATLMVLAFKPQHFTGAVSSLQRALAPDALVVSIMVGISTAKIEAALPTVRVVRIMPNTPMAVGHGMSAVARGARATVDDLEVAAAICAPSSEVMRVDESRIDDVAAVSGSGPAYFYRFCEVLMEAAQRQCGFTEEEARLLVAQTAKGAIAYAAAQDDFPVARLRREVTSPGGTTQAALATFDGGGLAELTARALAAAQARAQELNEAAG